MDAELAYIIFAERHGGSSRDVRLTRAMYFPGWPPVGLKLSTCGWTGTIERQWYSADHERLVCFMKSERPLASRTDEELRKVTQELIGFGWEVSDGRE